MKGKEGEAGIAVRIVYFDYEFEDVEKCGQVGFVGAGG